MMLRPYDKKSPRYIRMEPLPDKDGASFRLVTSDGHDAGILFSTPYGWSAWSGNNVHERRANHPNHVPCPTLSVLCKWVAKTTQMLIVVN